METINRTPWELLIGANGRRESSTGELDVELGGVEGLVEDSSTG